MLTVTVLWDNLSARSRLTYLFISVTIFFLMTDLHLDLKILDSPINDLQKYYITGPNPFNCSFIPQFVKDPSYILTHLLAIHDKSVEQTALVSPPPCGQHRAGRQTSPGVHLNTLSTTAATAVVSCLWTCCRPV